MKTTPILAASLVPLFVLSVACSSSPSTAGASKSYGGAGPATGAGTATDGELTAACDAQFDAMLARRARCPGPSPVTLASDEAERPDFVALCMDQAKNPGTGYTTAFRHACASALTNAACADADAVATACGAPKGALPRGASCAKDDQCAGGYCAMPDGGTLGSSCGTCSTPVWAKEFDSCIAPNARCLPGLVCLEYLDNLASCRAFDAKRGGTAGEYCTVGQLCAEGLGCLNSKCKPMKVSGLGEPCGYPLATCGGALVCAKGACSTPAALGEACSSNGDTAPTCGPWLECGSLKKCRRPTSLQCD